MSTHVFHPTRWTLVARATQDDAPAARAALDELCRLYWPPLCSFARRWGLSETDAEDATQNFFAELLRNDKFAIADPERGKLRTFLLHSFTQRLKNFRQRDPSQKNVPLDDVPPSTTDIDFDREWAITTMEAAMTQLGQEYELKGKADFFNACRPLLGIGAEGNEDYARIARALGMKEGALRVATSRLRLRFREVLFAVIAATLDQPSDNDVRAEIGVLMESLG